jgi:internalin A
MPDLAKQSVGCKRSQPLHLPRYALDHCIWGEAMGEYEPEDSRAAFIEAETRIEKAIKAQSRSLSLNDLGLTRVPAMVGQLTQLQELYLSQNQLASIPDAIGYLRELQMLFLRGNRLVTLPETLGQLTQLRELHLSHNQLTSIPDTIGRLRQLQMLHLDDNQLTALPETLGQLIQLQVLHLCNNQIASLPDSLRKLVNLNRFFLHGNDGLCLPSEVLGPTWRDVTAGRAKPAKPVDIFDYYFRVLMASRPLNEAKLILVGRGGVGKTSLANRLLFNRFNWNETKTEGIRICEWGLCLRGREDVRLHLWDFGGQEIMHATHQFFLTQRSLYLLVLEGRQGAEDDDAEYWLKLIESFGTENSGEVSPVLVVLNKINAHPFDLNRRALQHKYPFIRDFVVTDCQDGTGITELHDAVERQTDQLRHLRDSFPGSWFAIKNKLTSMKNTLKKSYLTFEEYRQVCADNNEKDARAQESLAFYLHSLGIVLNYKDDPRLRDTHVLNPHWVTNGIYTVLNAPLLAQQKGELRLADVTGILDVVEYPREMHRFLFDLMKKFELCFTFPDDDAHYLIPELLDKQEAEAAAEFRPNECLNFEYRYPVLPHGLLPRFIVRTHALSTGLPQWRTGVMLAFEGNQALVTADVQDKRVSIAVSGPASGRRRLLAIIRSDFERIHADISKLKPEALVPVPGQPNVAVRYAKLLALEAKGIQTFHEEVEGDVIELDVQALLNGVDLEGTRQREAPTEHPMRLFYSYSHKDEERRNELETHLKLLQRQGLIEPWYDRNIEAGDEWRMRIDENIEHADIILLLVSADFIASDYCYEKEMERALKRCDSGEAKVVPVIVRDVDWRNTPFARLQALPKNGKAVMEWPSKDAAWRNVSEGIARLVKELRKKNRL